MAAGGDRVNAGICEKVADAVGAAGGVEAGGLGGDARVVDKPLDGVLRQALVQGRDVDGSRAAAVGIARLDVGAHLRLQVAPLSPADAALVARSARGDGRLAQRALLPGKHGAIAGAAAAVRR